MLVNLHQSLHIVANFAIYLFYFFYRDTIGCFECFLPRIMYSFCAYLPLLVVLLVKNSYSRNALIKLDKTAEKTLTFEIFIGFFIWVFFCTKALNCPCALFYFSGFFSLRFPYFFN